MMHNSKDEPSTEEQRKWKILDVSVTPTDVVTDYDGEMGCLTHFIYYKRYSIGLVREIKIMDRVTILCRISCHMLGCQT